MSKAARKLAESVLDTELADLPPALRWREWMARVEAIIFAAASPVPRDVLTRVIGKQCNLDLILDDIGMELHNRPYELVLAGGGWQLRTRPAHSTAIRTAMSIGGKHGVEVKLSPDFSKYEATVLVVIGYLQPITRAELSKIFGKEISRDTIGALRNGGLIASGPRSPTPGAPYSYVTTPHFLSVFGLETLRDLPDAEMLEDAGLLRRSAFLDEAQDTSAQKLDEDQ